MSVEEFPTRVGPKTLAKLLDDILHSVQWATLKRNGEINRPYPSCTKPLFQSEAMSEAIDTKPFYFSDANETQYHKKGFTLNFVSKMRVFGTKKWHITQKKVDERKCSKELKVSHETLTLNIHDCILFTHVNLSSRVRKNYAIVEIHLKCNCWEKNADRRGVTVK